MIELHKNGDTMGIITDCKDEGEFLREISDLLDTMIGNGDFGAGGNSKQLKEFCDGNPQGCDWEFQLNIWLPQIVDVCCRYRGYKAPRVDERRVLTIGSFTPGAPIGKIGGLTDPQEINMAMKEKLRNLTWEEIIELSPSLKGLYEKALKEPAKRKKLKVWLEEYKMNMLKMVGWETDFGLVGKALSKADMKILQSPEAYDICYRKIYEVVDPGGAVGL